MGHGIVEIVELTEEEADALDEYYTAHVPQVGPNGTGFISRRNARLLGLDNLTMDYIWTKPKPITKVPLKSSVNWSAKR
jgi:hypothetical protein